MAAGRLRRKAVSAILNRMERTMESDTPAAADLTRTEAMLFKALQSQPGVVRTRRELLVAMHGKTRGNVQDHAVDTMISRLRENLGASGDCIETVRGRGFRWNPEHLSIDPASGAAFVGGQPVDLSSTEREVLADLASNAGHLRTPEELGSSFSDGTLRSIVASIRRKLGPADDCIETVHGRGYRFRPPAGSVYIPRSVRWSALFLALGILLVVAGLGALRVCRTVATSSVLTECPTDPDASPALPEEP
jgi:DNA-binding response OmpR family regulator